ncbi:hypothetical protein HYY69_04760 [Candidatus Woesearchaeota archaeon]|nr:hypothetical protein [Candidatus Woesearchaeota archaeon]
MLSLWTIILIDVIIAIVIGYFFIYKPLKENEKQKTMMSILAVVMIGIAVYFSFELYQPQATPKVNSLFPSSCDVLEEEMYIQSCEKTDLSHCYLYKTNDSIGVERLSNGVIFITAFDYNEGQFVQYTFYDDKKHINQGSQESFITKIHDKIANYYLQLQPGTYEHTRVKQLLTCFEDVVKEHDPEVINRILEKRDLEKARRNIEENKKKLADQLGENFTALDADLLEDIEVELVNSSK